MDYDELQANLLYSTFSYLIPREEQRMVAA